MQKCKWCQLAQELSTDAKGTIHVFMCRPCYRRMRKLETFKKERRQQKAK